MTNTDFSGGRKVSVGEFDSLAYKYVVTVVIACDFRQSNEWGRGIFICSYLQESFHQVKTHKLQKMLPRHEQSVTSLVPDFLSGNVCEPCP